MNSHGAVNSQADEMPRLSDYTLLLKNWCSKGQGSMIRTPAEESTFNIIVVSVISSIRITGVKNLSQVESWNTSKECIFIFIHKYMYIRVCLYIY